MLCGKWGQSEYYRETTSTSFERSYNFVLTCFTCSCMRSGSSHSEIVVSIPATGDLGINILIIIISKLAQLWSSVRLRPWLVTYNPNKDKLSD